jgi:hypothetical protein
MRITIEIDEKPGAPSSAMDITSSTGTAANATGTNVVAASTDDPGTIGVVDGGAAPVDPEAGSSGPVTTLAGTVVPSGVDIQSAGAAPEY